MASLFPINLGSGPGAGSETPTDTPANLRPVIVELQPDPNAGLTTEPQPTDDGSVAMEQNWDKVGHYALGRSVWNCQDMQVQIDALTVLRATMTGGGPQAITQPEIMHARLGPGLGYDVVTTLPQGTRANIIGVDPFNKWFQVEMAHINVPIWIFQMMAEVDGSLKDVREIPKEELMLLPISGGIGSRPVAVTQSEVMNVRLGPGLDYEVLTTVPGGTHAKVVGIDPSGAWLQLELESLGDLEPLGWVYRDLVEVACPLANVRRVTEREVSLLPAVILQTQTLFAFSGPGLAYDTVAVLPRGTWAKIIGIGDCPPTLWYQIEVAGFDEAVWVPRDFTRVAGGSLAGVPWFGVQDFDLPGEGAISRPRAVTLPITMNVRTGPGTDYEIAAVVPQGTQARIYGIDPGESWFLVEMEGYSSLFWLYRYMVQVSGSLVGIRSVTGQEVGAQPAVLIQPRAVFAQAGPGMEYDAVTILPKGTWARITGVDASGAWVEIAVVGMDRPVWVARNLVKTVSAR